MKDAAINRQRWYKMHVVVKEPGKKFCVTEVPDETKSAVFKLSEITGSDCAYMDIKKTGDRRIYAVLNKYGIENKLPENIVITEKHFYDVIRGTVVFFVGDIRNGKMYEPTAEELSFIERFIQTFAVRIQEDE